MPHKAAVSSEILGTKNLAADILASINTVSVYELQITSSSGGSEARGIPATDVIKKHRLKPARIVRKVKQAWITTGTAKVGDSTLTTSERLTMTNQIKQGDIIYDIVNELRANTAVGTLYHYIIRRSPATDPALDRVKLPTRPHRQGFIKQILGFMNTDKIYEIRATSESGGSEARGIPTTKVTKKHRLVSARIIEKVREEWITTGLAEVGDLTLVSPEQVDMNSAIEFDGNIYDIIEEFDADTFIGSYFRYIIRKDQP